MLMQREKLVVTTSKPREVIDVTDRINELLSRRGFADGLVALFLMHTTGALVTSALDPKTDLDILDAIEMTIPAYYSHLHHHSKVPAHIIASFLSSPLVVPVQDNRLLLGSMQRLSLIELNGPRDRTIAIDFIK